MLVSVALATFANVAFEQTSGDLVPGQNVPPAAPVLATRPIECAYGFDVTSLAVGGVLEFEHRRMGAVLHTDSFTIRDGTETVFSNAPLQANDQVAVLRRSATWCCTTLRASK